MTVGRFIVLIALGYLVFLTLDTYKEELLQTPKQVGKISTYTKAEGYYYASKYDQAVETYRAALAEGLREPQRKEAFFRIAIALDKGHHAKEAIEAFELAISSYPKAQEVSRARAALERLRLQTGS